MAPLPEIPLTSRVAFDWGPFTATNVMHFKQESIDPTGLFGALNANLLPNQWAAVAATQHIVQVTITPLDGSGLSQTFVPPTTTKWQGTQPGEIIPASSCVLSERTALRGRSFTGRAFLGPTTESSSAAGFNFAGVATAVATAWTTFATEMAADGATHVVASYLKKAATPVLVYLVRNALGTMRPRQSRLAL